MEYYKQHIKPSLGLIHACGENGSIRRSTDGGQSFSEVLSVPNAAFHGIAFTDDMSYGVAVGIYSLGGIVATSSDKGAHWAVRQGLSLPQPLYAVDINAAKIVIVGDNGFVATSSDSLVTLVTQPVVKMTITGLPGTSPAKLLDVKFYNATRVVASGRNGGLFTNDNAGQGTWTQSPSPVGYNLWRLAKTPSFIYVVGDYGTILKTSDGGTTWIQPANVGYNLRDLAFISDTEGWVVGETQGKVLHTTDGGATWFTYQTGGSWNFSNISAGLVGFLASVLTNGEVLESPDGGLSWHWVAPPGILPPYPGTYENQSVTQQSTVVATITTTTTTTVPVSSQHGKKK